MDASLGSEHLHGLHVLCMEGGYERPFISARVLIFLIYKTFVALCLLHTVRIVFRSHSVDFGSRPAEMLKILIL